MISRILGGLYLSDIEELSNTDHLIKEGITHIVSVISGPIDADVLSKVTHKQIEINDEETSNMLEYLNEATEFIDSAFTSDKKNKVLVHCAQGVSRSPTVIAAYLMFKHKLSVTQAVYALQRKNSHVQPNAGFMNQLDLFQKMNCKVDINDPTYKQFVKDNQLQIDPTGSSLREMGVMVSGKILETRDINQKGQTSNQIVHYRCKKCRKILATNTDIEDHEQPDEESDQSKFYKRNSYNRIVGSQQGSTICSHYFLSEPVAWMSSELNNSEIEGKFNCPNDKCGAKVGGYSWKGSRCSCGKWVIPAIHLQSAKVDQVIKTN